MRGKDVSWHTLAFMCRLTEALRPKRELTISQWAQEHMVFSQGTNEPGKFDPDTMPHQKEIMDAITDPSVVDVTVMSSAQIGKTTIEMCGIGYYIDHETTTQMLVMPTIDDAEKFSKTKFAPMVADVKVLNKVLKAKSRDSNNTILLKQYPGGCLVISGANSPSSLSMLSTRIIWMDEIDRFPESAGTEGNPIRLAEKRATSYWNKKFIKLSTPTRKGSSNIEEEFQKGTMERWSVKCPECGEFQTYDFKRVVFENPPVMVCKHCGCKVPERRWKESEHRWIAEHPERKKRRSFWMNELGSPMTEWDEIIQTFLDANKRMVEKHDLRDMIVFINTVLGETWDETLVDSEAADAGDIEKRAERYDAELPEGVLLLTAAIDVQKDRLEVEVRGWARDYETWGIYYNKIYGDLTKNNVWEQMEAYLERTFEFADGRRLGIAGFAIDTGGLYTNKVYQWAKEQKQKGKKCFAIKGYAGKDNIPLIHNKRIVNITEERGSKRVVVDRTVLQMIGVNSGKEDITNRLKITEPGEGYCHFPKNEDRGYDHQYYKGLTSEHKIEKNVRGVLRSEWVKESGARNEPLDLMNYNYATVELIRPDWDALEEKIEKGINYMERPAEKKRARRTIDGIEGLR